jgi:hypothetical protein
MNAKDAILKIRALFEETTEEVVEVQLAEYVLADGTKIMVSSMEVGGDVTLADGSVAPAGEYALADGNSIQVDETGKIIEIASPKEDTMPEEAPADMGAKKVQEMEEAFKLEVEALKAENQKLKEELQSINDKIKEGFSQVISLVEIMAQVPQADPIEQPKAHKFEATKDIKFDRLNKYRNAILNNKN